MNRLLAAIISALLLFASTALAQSDTAFTYQGTLSNAGSPANGTFLMTFALYDALAGGTQIGTTMAIPNQSVAEGYFSTGLDFGASVFDNTARWLEITVDGDTLAPRQPITRSPYSIQTRGIYVDDAHRVGLGTTQPATELHIKGVQPAMRLQKDSDPDSYSEIRDGTTSQMRINKVHGAGGVLLDVNPKPADGLGSAEVRFFRETNTTGLKIVDFLRGNFTTQASARIGVDGADSFFQAHGGRLSIGDPAGPNVTIDHDEIIAQDNGSWAPLRLNPTGAPIEMGQYGLHPAYAYGNIGFNGEIYSGSSNITSCTNVGAGEYRIRFAQGFDRQSDIVQAQPIGYGGVAFVREGEIPNELRITIITSLNSTPVSQQFSFVIYRP